MSARKIIIGILERRTACLHNTAAGAADEILTRLLGAQVETLSPTDLRHDMLLSSLTALNGAGADPERRVFMKELNLRLGQRETNQKEATK